ncbi:MAG TPA: hypothetical protein VFB63_19605 [Bryobacteraceae bacterium]|nr:hypothetical protein [Bryobacteraceae bacterium]
MADETRYTWAQLEAAACMWQHVWDAIHRRRTGGDPWLDYRDAYGTVALRCAVISHAPTLLAAYEAALTNGYKKDFDLDFVPNYMKDHVTRILT